MFKSLPHWYSIGLLMIVFAAGQITGQMIDSVVIGQRAATEGPAVSRSGIPKIRVSLRDNDGWVGWEDEVALNSAMSIHADVRGKPIFCFTNSSGEFRREPVPTENQELSTPHVLVWFGSAEESRISQAW